MKKIAFSILIFLLVMVITVTTSLYLQRNSRSALLCSSLDDSIRPRNYCLMNPFRNKQPEKMAERILQELKIGNAEVIIPYLNNANEDEKNRFLENEKKYQIKNWRVGSREDSEDEISLMYWVSRQNYHKDHNGSDHLEAVNFYFVREENNWNLQDFRAGY